MAMNRVAQQAEVEANLIAFEADLPSLLAKSKGKYAAYRQCRLVAVSLFDGPNGEVTLTF